MKQKGYADILLGLQFGDEGKARVIDRLAPQYDVIARFNGGSNVGHTIKTNKGIFVIKQIPSGVFHKKTKLYIGSGCVVDLEKLATEIDQLASVNLSVKKRLKISGQASIIQPHHVLLDEMWGKGVGTTKNGIGPSYADRAMRMYGVHLANVRLGDLRDDPKQFESCVLYNLEMTKKRYKLTSEDTEKIMQRLKKAFEKVAPFIEDDPLYLEKKVEKGARVLFEGAQSAMLDIVKGSVPYVTSSHTIAAAAYVGGDLSIKYHRKTMGVLKAFMSRVGYGPFPSEFGGEESEEYCMETAEGKPVHSKEAESTYDVDELLTSADHFYIGIALRRLADEYGPGTKRPRRIGRLDLVQLRYATRMNGVDELIITKCNILASFSKTRFGGIPIVDGYKLDGKTIDYVPVSSEAFYRVKPIISYEKPFTEDISHMKQYNQLPSALKKHIKLIEKASCCKVIAIDVGPNPDQHITLP